MWCDRQGWVVARQPAPCQTPRGKYGELSQQSGRLCASRALLGATLSSFSGGGEENGGRFWGACVAHLVSLRSEARVKEKSMFQMPLYCLPSLSSHWLHNESKAGGSELWSSLDKKDDAEAAE